MLNTYRTRLAIVACVFFLIFSIIFIRLIWMQAFNYPTFSNLARKQHNIEVQLPPNRGTVFDRNGRVLAIDLNLESIYAVPRKIKDKEKLAALLSPILGLSADSIEKKITNRKGFVWLRRQVGPDAARQIKALKRPEELGLIKEPKRFYPNSSLGSHLIGFTGIDNTGLEGLELLYAKYLKGKAGVRLIERDAKQRKIAYLQKRYIAPQDGMDLVLTIDEVIQSIAEIELDNAFKKYNARGGSIIVMDPKSGEILALANRPTYDPNFVSKFPSDSRRNRAICDVYEPGSSFKIITCSAVLQENIVKPEDKYFCEYGAWKVAGHVLHDHQPHGWLTFREVIEKSSNIGTVKAATKLGDAKLYKYIKAFGFGQKTGVTLPGEVSGILRPLNTWSKSSITAVPMGHEIGVTSLQLACAISAIANDGILVKPLLVKRIQNKKGKILKEYESQNIRQIFTPKTAAIVKSILAGVVENGTAKLAAMKEWHAAGKTGTGQKLEPNGRYSHSKFTASFIGFAPVEDPLVTVVVILDEPHPIYYGGVACAPVFKQVASQTLKYLQVQSINSETVEVAKR